MMEDWTTNTDEMLSLDFSMRMKSAFQSFNNFLGSRRKFHFSKLRFRQLSIKPTNVLYGEATVDMRHAIHQESPSSSS